MDLYCTDLVLSDDTMIITTDIESDRYITIARVLCHWGRGLQIFVSFTARNMATLAGLLCGCTYRLSHDHRENYSNVVSSLLGESPVLVPYP